MPDAAGAQRWLLRFISVGQKRVTLEKDFALRAEHRTSIHPELKWIISLPLKKKGQHTVAVLNVDVLRQVINEATLDQFADKLMLMQEFVELEKQIQKLPCCKIGIALT